MALLLSARKVGIEDNANAIIPSPYHKESRWDRDRMPQGIMTSDRLGSELMCWSEPVDFPIQIRSHVRTVTTLGIVGNGGTNTITLRVTLLKRTITSKRFAQPVTLREKLSVARLAM